MKSKVIAPYSIETLDAGDGSSDTLVVAVHGMWDSSKDWYPMRDQLVRLAQGGEVTAINLPGHGGDNNTEHLTIPRPLDSLLKHFEQISGRYGERVQRYAHKLYQTVALTLKARKYGRWEDCYPELCEYIQRQTQQGKKITLVGHSMGAEFAMAAATDPELGPYIQRVYALEPPLNGVRIAAELVRLPGRPLLEPLARNVVVPYYASVGLAQLDLRERWRRGDKPLAPISMVMSTADWKYSHPFWVKGKRGETLMPPTDDLILVPAKHTQADPYLKQAMDTLISRHQKASEPELAALDLAG